MKKRTAKARRSLRKPLIQSLKDKNIDVQVNAAWALGHLNNVIAVEPLLKLQQDANPILQKVAQQVLVEIKAKSGAETPTFGTET